MPPSPMVYWIWIGLCLHMASGLIWETLLPGSPRALLPSPGDSSASSPPGVWHLPDSAIQRGAYPGN